MATLLTFQNILIQQAEKSAILAHNGKLKDIAEQALEEQRAVELHTTLQMDLRALERQFIWVISIVGELTLGYIKMEARRRHVDLELLELLSILEFYEFVVDGTTSIVAMVEDEDGATRIHMTLETLTARLLHFKDGLYGQVGAGFSNLIKRNPSASTGLEQAEIPITTLMLVGSVTGSNTFFTVYNAFSNDVAGTSITLASVQTSASSRPFILSAGSVSKVPQSVRSN